MYHKFIGRVHSKKENRAFVLMNNGDYFGATIFPEKSQLAQLEEGDELLIRGNIRQTKGDKGDYFTNITVPRGETLKLAKRSEQGWELIEPTEGTVTATDDADLPF